MPKPTPTPVTHARMTVVETVSYSPPNEESVGFDSRFGKLLKTTEQPYMRRTVIGVGWQPLDLGWLKDKEVAMIMIYNLESLRGLARQPTEKQKSEILEKVIEVSFSKKKDELFLIYAGESARFLPSGTIYLRSRSGESRYKVAVIPS